MLMIYWSPKKHLGTSLSIWPHRSLTPILHDEIDHILCTTDRRLVASCWSVNKMRWMHCVGGLGVEDWVHPYMAFPQLDRTNMTENYI